MTPRSSWSLRQRSVATVRRALRSGVLSAVAGLLLFAPPADARILKTKRFISRLALTVGSGLEFETDTEGTQYGLPFLAEYAISEAFTVALEPNYVSKQSKTTEPSASGWGDFETTLTWEGSEPRRRLPGFSIASTIKWPTASTLLGGSGKRDYSLRLVLSKTRRSLSVDAGLAYTWVGRTPDARNSNAFEASLAFEWAAGFVVDLEGEILTSTGAFTSRPGTISGLGSADQGGGGTEATLGIAEHLFDRLKLEEGGVFNTDGSWQFVFAWEWEFGSR